MSELVPPPADLAALLVTMTALAWPTTDADRHIYFATLGLTDKDVLPRRERDPYSVSRRLATSLPAVDGIWTTFREGFLGLSLFCYDEPIDEGPRARAGYAALHHHLVRHFGQPVEEWGVDAAPAAMWRPGSLTLEMYCFQRHHSGVMVGPHDSNLSAAYDAARGALDTARSPDAR